MISHNSFNSQKTASRIHSFLKSFSIASLATECGFIKRNGAEASYLLQLAIVYGFGLASSVYALFSSKRAVDINAGRSAMYSFMSNGKFNWEKLHFKLALKLINAIYKINKTNKCGYLVCDDTTLKRERSKKVELLSVGFDHVFGRAFKGFTELSLGWTDGISFIPVRFTTLSAKKDESILNKVAQTYDKRSLAYKRRALSRMSKLDVLLKLVGDILKQGCPVSYLLMDSWYTMDKVITPVKALGLDVIGMMKDFKANIFTQKPGDMTRVRLKALIKKYGHMFNGNICGSCIVYTKSGTKIKLVFIKNRHDKSSILTIGSTDTTLSEKDIVTRYSYRWGCETHFFIKKQYLGFEKGCQARNYDHIVAHCTICSIRFMVMQYLERSSKDFRLGGELFANLCEELRTNDFTQALNYIYSTIESKITRVIKKTIRNTKQRLKLIATIHNIFYSSYNSLSNYVKSLLDDDLKLKFSDIKAITN